MTDTTDEMEAGAAMYESFMEQKEWRFRNKEWVQKSGTIIKVGAMTDRHIRNTVSMLLKYNRDRYRHLCLAAATDMKAREQLEKVERYGWQDASTRWIAIFQEEREKREDD